MTINKYLDYVGLTQLSTHIKNRLKVVSIIPESPSDGDIILYMGETTEDYTRGCLYSYVLEDDEWILESSNTKIKLNGTYATEEVEIYAPTQAGDTGKVLVAMGENEEPEWRDPSGYCPQLTDDILSFSWGDIPAVDGTALVFDI